MDENYISNPAVRLLAEQVEPGSTEAEVQKLWDNILWTEYPAAQGWMNASRHRTGATEPDNVVSKLIQFYGGWSTVDLMFVELKRPKERVSRRDFDDNVNNYLDDFLAESANPDGTILFGAVRIELHVMFYSRVLPRGHITSMHANHLHLIDDAQDVQEHFRYTKRNVPSAHYVPAVPVPAAVVPAAVVPAAAIPEPTPHYYREGKRFSHTSSDHPPRECPTEVWVRDRLGWSTGGGEKWRWRYSDKTHTYRDDDDDDE